MKPARADPLVRDLLAFAHALQAEIREGIANGRLPRGFAQGEVYIKGIAALERRAEADLGDEEKPDPTIKPPTYQALSEGYNDDLMDLEDDVGPVE